MGSGKESVVAVHMLYQAVRMNLTPATSLQSKPQKHLPIRDSAFSGESLPPQKKSLGFTWYLSVKSAPSVVCDLLHQALPKAVVLLACL